MVHRKRKRLVFAALMALALQLIAPGWAIRAAMSALSVNPIANAPICSDHDQPDGQKPLRPGHQPPCPVCQIACHAGHAVVASPAACPVPLQVGWVAHGRYHAAAPRGPPFIFAQARAPPFVL